MHVFVLIFALLFALASCIESTENEAKTDIQELTVTNSSLRLTEQICQTGIFPGSKKVDSSIHPFGEACELHELSGIEMENPITLYLCQSTLLLPDFPGNHDVKTFPLARVKRILGDNAKKSDLLASYGFAGKWFSLLLFKDHTHGTEFTIATKDALKGASLTLTSDESALAFAYLHGVMGTHNGHSPYFASKALCGATLEKDDKGWLLKNADVFVNCQPREKRNIRISNHGKVTIVKKTSAPNKPALCID